MWVEKGQKKKKGNLCGFDEKSYKGRKLQEPEKDIEKEIKLKG